MMIGKNFSHLIFCRRVSIFCRTTRIDSLDKLQLIIFDYTYRYSHIGKNIDNTLQT